MTVSIATISLEEVANEIGVDLDYALARFAQEFLRGGHARERAKLVKALRDRGLSWQAVASMIGFKSHSGAMASYKLATK